MNTVIVIGNVTRDPEVRVSAKGTSVARYGMALNRRGKDAEGADFINLVAFNGAAEFAEKYIHKGMKLAVRGHIQTGSYTNKDGVKVSTFDVVVDDQEFVGPKISESAPAPAAAPKEDGNGFMELPDSVDDDFMPWN